jgi:hypothetical protein
MEEAGLHFVPANDDPGAFARLPGLLRVPVASCQLCALRPDLALYVDSHSHRTLQSWSCWTCMRP